MNISIQNNIPKYNQSLTVTIYQGDAISQLYLATEHCPLLILLKMCLMIFFKNVMSTEPFFATLDAISNFCNKP